MTQPAEQFLPPMKWNAWGDPQAAKPLSDGIRSLLQQALGVEAATGRRDDARAGAVAAIGAVGGRSRRPHRDRRRSSTAVPTPCHDCCTRAASRHWIYCAATTSGVQDAPDAVLLPGSEDEVAAILA